jgi:hypothetical protein
MKCNSDGYIGETKLPIGIPLPSFGMSESVDSIYGAGYFTHYVDNTHPLATDSNNPKGTKDLPRKTPPTKMVAGDVVEIHGGPYDFEYVFSAAGTKEKPVFIRGTDIKPRFNKRVGMNLSHQFILLSRISRWLVLLSAEMVQIIMSF